MIGQYLSNTNEKATVSILQNILELNKAQLSTNDDGKRTEVGPAIALRWRIGRGRWSWMIQLPNPEGKGARH